VLWCQRMPNIGLSNHKLASMHPVITMHARRRQTDGRTSWHDQQQQQKERKTFYTNVSPGFVQTLESPGKSCKKCIWMSVRTLCLSFRATFLCRYSTARLCRPL